MFVSISKWQRSLCYWLKKRFARILLPCCLIVIPGQLFVDSLKGGGITETLLYISTVPYWTNHDGEWFIIAILILYSLTPLIRIFERSHNIIINSFFFVVMIVTCCVVGNISFISKGDSRIIQNAQFIIVRMPSFFLGYWIASFIKNGKEGLLCISIDLVLLLFLLFFRVKMEKSWLLSMPITAIIHLGIISLSRCKCGVINRILFFAGSISLESYLTNVYTAKIAKELFDSNMIHSMVVYYLIIAIIGFIVAVIMHRVVTCIQDYSYKPKERE